MDKKNKMFTWICGQNFKAYLLNDGRIKVQVYEPDYNPWEETSRNVPSFSFVVSVNTLRKLVNTSKWASYGPLVGHEECGCEGFEFTPEIKKIVKGKIGQFISGDESEILEQKRIIRSVLRHVGA